MATWMKVVNEQVFATGTSQKNSFSQLTRDLQDGCQINALQLSYVGDSVVKCDRPAMRHVFVMSE